MKAIVHRKAFVVADAESAESIYSSVRRTQQKWSCIDLACRRNQSVTSST